MQNLENVVLKSTDLLNTIGKIAEDGKFNWVSEMWLLIPHVKDIGLISKAIPSLEEEIINITPQALARIQDKVVQQLDFSDEVAEEIAEEVIQWVVATTKATLKIIAAAKAKKAAKEK